jgi:hypothetical protein
MDSLVIEQTNDSPAINFDTNSNRFIISGESRPENAIKFYEPIVKWLTNFEGILYWRKQELKDNAGTVIFIFKLDYFNSTSAKHIMDVLLVLKKYTTVGYKINIEWHYSKLGGDDMLDAGQEFSSMLGLTFNFIES